jgi:hypothetical protein
MFVKRIDKNEAINLDYVNRIYVRKDETDDGINYAIVAEMWLEGENGSYEAIRLGSYDAKEEAEAEFVNLMKLVDCRG